MKRHLVTLSPGHLVMPLLVAVGGLMFVRLAAAPPPEVEIAGFATSLKGRTASQRHNAKLAAQRLNGRIIKPCAVFSFNKAVRSWTLDQGYVKAPVSYDGELIRAYGGGVCQTSTTLYNVALLAGLPILERHTHVFVPHYIPPGRDAAVAQQTVDLRFRNPYPWPLRIRATAKDDRLEVRLLGKERPRTQVQIATSVLSVNTPVRRTRVVYESGRSAGRAFVRNPGVTGYRIVTYRIFSQEGRETKRERLSDDTYQPMDRIVQLNEELP